MPDRRWRMQLDGPVSLRLLIGHEASAVRDPDLIRVVPESTLEGWARSAATIEQKALKAKERHQEQADPTRALRDPEQEKNRQQKIDEAATAAITPLVTDAQPLVTGVFEQKVVQTAPRILLDHAVSLTVDIGGDSAAALERLLRLDGPSASVRELVSAVLARATRSQTPDLTLLAAAATLAGKAPPADRKGVLERVYTLTAPVVQRRRVLLRETLQHLVQTAATIDEILTGHTYVTDPNGPAQLLQMGHYLEELAPAATGASA